MPDINDPPPPEVQQDLNILRSALEQRLPQKLLDQNLLIATWRWNMVNDVTMKWISAAEDRPQRDLRSVRCLAEILSRFDVTAIQGVMGSARALQLVMEILGDPWELMVTGLSQESTYKERMAFVFDRRKVRLNGLAGQVILSEAELKDLDVPKLLSRQFFRPPFFAGFQCLDQPFTLANMHLVYGQNVERLLEVRAIARWLRQLHERVSPWETNIIALGQMQFVREGSELYNAFTSSGLYIPEDLLNAGTYVNHNGIPMTMMSAIAWFRDTQATAGLQLHYRRGGVFNFVGAGLEFVDQNPKYVANFLSNHLPMWAEFSLQRTRRIWP
jgi:hypothetical protein